MQIIPVLIKPKEDELLISYLYRLAFANDFQHVEDAFSTYFQATWSGCGNALINIAEQLGLDPIDFFLDTTTFSYDQLFMTREQHKNSVKCLFTMSENTKNDNVLMPNYFRRAEICKECALVESDKRIIHRSLQVPGGYCFEHNRRTFVGQPIELMTGDINAIKDTRIVPASKFPSYYDLASNDIAQGLLRNEIVICYDDAVTLIKHMFTANRLFDAKNFLLIADMNINFFGNNARIQMDYLSDAFYFLNNPDMHVSLAPYRRLLMGLLAVCVDVYEGLLELLPSRDKVWQELEYSVTRQGYIMESTELRPILKVKDALTNISKYVSPYTVLDGELAKY